MPKNITLPSPAKLNLFLYITGQREDGYHELQTLFQFLDFGDTLSFALNNSNNITISPSLNSVPTEENLIYKAAKLLQKHTQTTRGVDIVLDKILPMGGGLGGGSSNAATTLVALNHLWNTQVPEKKLCELGLTLGADVPVFIQGKAAFAEGVGEKLRPINIDEKWYLVVKPPVHISTAKIFNHPDLIRNTPKRTLNALLINKYENDCEKIVRELFPEVDKALSWLLEYAPSKLTGTGACIFAEFTNESDARSTLTKLPDWLTGFVARGVNTSPLLSTLDIQNQ